jgi:phage terminase large subunit-like protein
MRYQQALFDTMMLGLRLGDRPRVLIATTPTTTPFIAPLTARRTGLTPRCGA